MTVYYYDWNLLEMFQACLHLVKLFWYLETDRAQFWQEIHFYSYLGIKDNKIGGGLYFIIWKFL